MESAGPRPRAIVARPALQYAPAVCTEIFYEVIDKFDDRFDSVAIFSHNPGITDFANSLSDTRIDSIPTCGIFAVKASIEKWKDFKKADKEFWFVDYPKAGLD